MCIIVDADVIGKVANKHKETAPIHSYLRQGGKIVYNSILLNEYKGDKDFLSLFLVLRTRGQTFEFDYDPSPEIKKKLTCNDVHVIDLAIKSGARVLYSADKKLRSDFRKKDIIAPQGKLYSGPASKSILNRTCRSS